MKKFLMVLLLIAFGAGGPAVAEDTDIFGVRIGAGVQPNVLLIIDNSGSMSTQDVHSAIFAHPYAGERPPDHVWERVCVSMRTECHMVNGWYEKGTFGCNETNRDWVARRQACNGLHEVCEQICDWEWRLKVHDNDPANPVRIDDYVGETYTELIEQGWSDLQENSLRTGSYLNYLDEVKSDEPRKRIEVAQEALCGLIDRTRNVRFGLMRFYDCYDRKLYRNGGYLMAACGEKSNDELKALINGILPEGGTPLAETLATAGLYFAGKFDWWNAAAANMNNPFTSPIQYRCQENHIIFMTDGEPTVDGDAPLGTNTDYIETGHYLNSMEKGATDSYLDDVAWYLGHADLRPDLGSPADFNDQNVITWTIGFKTDQELLANTARLGGGEYFTANRVADLNEAFETILGRIVENNASFVSPTVPVSNVNRSYSGEFVYMGLFRPTNTGQWLGNIKKYRLSGGELLDADHQPATENGVIRETARSFWSVSPDGRSVNAGGVGAVMAVQSYRNIYTFTDDTEATDDEKRDLTSPANAFVADNPRLSGAPYDLSEHLIQSARGYQRDWKLGDILHSEPAVVHYGPGRSVIFAGGNDGMLHCFDDETGREIWAFIPPGQLDRLHLLENDVHDYFVDGSPVVYNAGDYGKKVLMVGERRGGHSYYALDVSDYERPRWMFRITTSGQSWSRPRICRIARNDNGEVVHDRVFLVSGGYDVNQDADLPAPMDTRGMGVYAYRIDAAEPTLSSLHFDPGNTPSENTPADFTSDPDVDPQERNGFTHGIVDLTAIDPDGDGIVSRVYAGDLAGRMFAFRDDDEEGAVDGIWSAVNLFASLDEEGNGGRKMFHAPDVVEEEYGEILFFGTGDRVHPLSMDVVNRFYSVVNDGTFQKITEATRWRDLNPDLTGPEGEHRALLDVTDNLIQMGAAEEKNRIRMELADRNNKGWFMRLEEPGEKVVSTPITFAGVVYFTTYVPQTTGAEDGDPCRAPSSIGTGRLYALDYLTGAAVFNFYDEAEYDADGEPVGLGKRDRWLQLEDPGIPPSPVIVIPEDSRPRILVGPQLFETVPRPDMTMFYWRVRES